MFAVLSVSIEFTVLKVFSLSAFFRASIVCLLFVVFGVFSMLSEQSMLHVFVVLSRSIVFLLCSKCSVCLLCYACL